MMIDTFQILYLKYFGWGSLSPQDYGHGKATKQKLRPEVLIALHNLGKRPMEKNELEIIRVRNSQKCPAIY